MPFSAVRSFGFGAIASLEIQRIMTALETLSQMEFPSEKG